MANVLQDYFNRMTSLNRQRGMTGNMQYGKALDGAIAEGYFDSYAKNKAQSQSLANQKAALGIQRLNANSNMLYNQRNLDMTEKAINNNNMLGWGQLATTALGAGTKLYLGRERQQPAPRAIPSANLNDAWNPATNTQADFGESLFGVSNGTVYDGIDTQQYAPEENYLDWEFGSEMFGDSGMMIA